MTLGAAAGRSAASSARLTLSAIARDESTRTPSRSKRIADRATSSPGPSAVVVDKLDVVAIGVQDVGAVVPAVVVRALAGGAVVAVAGLHRGGVKGVDGLVRARREGHVEVLRQVVARQHREGTGVAVEARSLGRVGVEAKSRVRGDRLVEALRGPDAPHPYPEVVDAVADILVVHGLDAVLVRIEQKAAVVVRAVLGARAGLAVAPIARAGPDLPEFVDALARRRPEADVKATRHRAPRVGGREREVVPLRELVVAVLRLDAEHPEDGVVEGLRGAAVRDPDGDVVEHTRELTRTTGTRYSRTTRTVPAASSAMPSSFCQVIAFSSRPSTPRRSSTTDAVSWPAMTATVTPPAPSSRTPISDARTMATPPTPPTTQ